MKYYPVNLDIRNRNCLVVGGGGVGTRKVATLVECGARVTLVSPDVTGRLEDLIHQGRIEWKSRPYRRSDLGGMFLVIGATDDETLNARIHQDAEERHMLCNIADRPKACNFILPAVVQRGDLLIAVSTSGASPAMAKRLRKQLENQFGEEYGRLLELMGAIRKQLLAEAHAPEAHKPLFERLLSGDLLERIRKNDRQGIDAILLDVLGKGYTFKALMQGEK